MNYIHYASLLLAASAATINAKKPPVPFFLGQRPSPIRTFPTTSSHFILISPAAAHDIGLAAPLSLSPLITHLIYQR